VEWGVGGGMGVSDAYEMTMSFLEIFKNLTRFL